MLFCWFLCCQPTEPSVFGLCTVFLHRYFLSSFSFLELRLAKYSTQSDMEFSCLRLFIILLAFLRPFSLFLAASISFSLLSTFVCLRVSSSSSYFEAQPVASLLYLARLLCCYLVCGRFKGLSFCLGVKQFVSGTPVIKSTTSVPPPSSVVSDY